MKKNNVIVTALRLAVFALLSCSICSHAQVKDAYQAMAPLDQYLIGNEESEITLARSAAPSSVSDGAEVMVLGRDGYRTVRKGSNSFLCIVERSWANTTDNSEFWNPKIRAPHCLNAAATSSFLPFYLMKTKLVLAGKSRAEIAAALPSIPGSSELKSAASDTIVYMMSKQQYLNDGGMSWRPHVMFYVTGDAEKTQGANLHGSPVMAAYDPEQRVTTFFVLVPEWSDGTPAPSH